MSKYAKILFHEVEYWYEDYKDKEITEIDKEYIIYMINDGYSSGQLVSYDRDGDKGYYGWWQIKGYETQYNINKRMIKNDQDE